MVNDTRRLTRAVWAAFLLLLGAALAFAGYYYWDRYVHVGDQSPLEKGIQELEAQVRANPTEPEPRLALAEFYLANQRYGDALEQAEQVLNAYPEDERALFVVGLAYTLKGETGKGVTTLEKFAARRRGLPTAGHDMALETALYYLGSSYIKLDRPQDAIAVLEEALKINPTDADARYQLGLAQQRSGDCVQALDSLHRAAAFVPDFAEAYKAMEPCYASLELPDHALYARGMAAYAARDYQQAASQLSQAAQRLPDFAPAHAGLGLTLEELGDLPGAKASLERAVALDPESFIAKNALGRVDAALEK
ncbi:MAG: tetratricopeptide repeat protein [Chloroflexi bacterium]|nr:tetratricopeptide repeat protein [Chloroflexota bacterium]